MRILRSILARIVIAIGVLVLGFWLSARFVVNTVNDGTLISSIASSALHTENIQSQIANQAQSAINSQLTDEGIDPNDPAIQNELSDGIEAAVESEGFIDSVVDIIKEIESSVIAQLTDDSLPLEPISITVDVSEPLYAALATNPLLVNLIPTSDIDPVSFEALDEDTVETVRGGYDWVERVNTWGIWIALGLLAIGFLLIRKKRWILPKLLLGLGIFTLGLWWIARWLDVEWIIGRMGDDPDENVESTIRDIFPQETIDNAEASLFKWAIAFLVISAALYVFVWWFFRRLKHRGEDSGGEPEPVPEPVASPEPVPVSTPSEMVVEAAGETKVETAVEVEPPVTGDPSLLDGVPPSPDAPLPLPKEPPDPVM